MTDRVLGGADALLVPPSASWRELLNRQYVGGVAVTNCVVHMGESLFDRPWDCRLCAADIRNALGRAISVNEWLNAWKNEAAAYLAGDE